MQLGASSFVLFLTSLAVRGSTVDFDAPNDLPNNFVFGGSYQQSSSGGITGGAVMSTPGTGGFATLSNPEAQPLFGGGSASISFWYNNPPAAEIPIARIGWGGDQQAVALTTANSYVWVELFGGDGALRYVNQNTGTESGGVGPITGLQSDHWLKLEISVTPFGRPQLAQYTLSGVLSDLGPTGVDAPTTLASGTTTIQNFNMATDFSVFPGFFGDAPKFDNFSSIAIPEPTSVSLVGLGGCLVIGMRLRRSR